MTAKKYIYIYIYIFAPLVTSTKQDSPNLQATKVAPTFSATSVIYAICTGSVVFSLGLVVFSIHGAGPEMFRSTFPTGLIVGLCWGFPVTPPGKSVWAAVLVKVLKNLASRGNSVFAGSGSA